MTVKGKKTRRKNTDNPFASVFMIAVLAVLLANVWAGWKILKIADVLEIPLFGPVHQGPAQLAALLLINCIVISLLVVSRKN
ncbi:MAG: hypothetical protein PHV59_01320 [Victivallales bacterium]|nr:hypothetical protein [Victivallales bacterium]